MSDTQTGVGVTIDMLSGYESDEKALAACIGKVMRAAVIEDDKLRITFDDCTTLVLWDNGQSCCEHRYMTTDDDLTRLKGETLVGVAVVDAPDVKDDGEYHEVQFLNIKSNLATVQLANHNEHNGYYGGFSLRAKVT